MQMNQATCRTLAATLFGQWGLTGWNIKFRKMARALGKCYGGRKLIVMSVFHVNNDDANVVLDTLKHEIAHALTFVRYGGRASGIKGHGAEFRAMAELVGCSPDGCKATAPVGSVKVVPGNYYAICPGCSTEIQFYRKPKGERYHVKCGPEKGSLAARERVSPPVCKPVTDFFGGLIESNRKK